MIGVTISHYTIESVLGRGGMGVVYIAHDDTLDRTVAIKFLTADLTADDVAKNRFLREAQAAAAIQHEAICAIHEIGETDDGQMYIVMPFYEGQTLKDFVNGGPLPPKLVENFSRQIASGLQAAHNKGVIHRDIKPGNIIVDEHQHVKILDFGLAKLSGQMDLTQTSLSVGTVPYMAPEQLLSRTVDARTDIWALGAVMYEMLTGYRPFEGEYEQAVSYAIVNLDPKPPHEVVDGVPERLSQIVLKCLDKDPETRYQNVDQLLEDLSSPEKTVSTDTAATKKRAVTVNITPAKFAALFIALSIVLGGSFFYFSRISGPAGISERHLAILPFRLIGGGTDAEAFSYGLLETLTSSLTQLQRTDETLWVVPSSEVDATMSLSDAKRLLGANLVVTGSVQMEGDVIRVALMLNDAETNRIISSDQFDDSGSGSFAIQDEAVRRLTRMLGMRGLSGTEFSFAASTVKTANDAFLKAKGYLRNQQSVQDLDVAIGLLTSAIEDDPKFASAYSALGLAYWQKYSHTEDSRWVDEALQYSQQALELDDQLSDVHVTLASIQEGLRDYGAALEEYDLALEIDSTNSEAYRLRASSLRGLGRIDEAKASLDKSIELAPDYWRGYYSLALHHFRQKDFDETIRAAQMGLDRAPDVLRLHNIQAVSLWSQGKVREAMQRFDRIKELDPEYTPAWGNTATALFYSQRFDEAAEMYEKVVSRLRPNSYAYRGFLADAYYWSQGNRDKADATYREAIELAREQLVVSDIDPDVYSSIAGYYAHLGEVDSAKVYLDKALTLYPEDALSADNAFFLGELHVTLGDMESAKVWLEKGLSQGAGWMQLEQSPWLAPVRADADFISKMAVYRK